MKKQIQQPVVSKKDKRNIYQVYKDTLPHPDALGTGTYRTLPGGKKEILEDIWKDM